MAKLSGFTIGQPSAPTVPSRPVWQVLRISMITAASVIFLFDFRKGKTFNRTRMTRIGLIYADLTLVYTEKPYPR
jgi:hypothetical protein